MTTKREPVDMSAKAIAARLDTVGALYKLMLSFREIPMDQAKPVNTARGKSTSTKGDPR